MVLDASAAVELLLNSRSGKEFRERLATTPEIHAPHLIDIEIAHALRRLVRREVLGAGRAAFALGLWRQLDVERHQHDILLGRIWSWRNNLSAYDAAYIALAEALRQPLPTGAWPALPE